MIESGIYNNQLIEIRRLLSAISKKRKRKPTRLTMDEISLIEKMYGACLRNYVKALEKRADWSGMDQDYIMNRAYLHAIKEGIQL